MKPIFLFLGLLGSFAMYAQVFTGTPVQVRDQQLNEYFTTCEVFALDGRSFHQRITRDNSPDRIELHLGDKRFSWYVEENNMLRPETRGTTMSNGEYVPLPFDRSCITYKAISTPTGEESRLTITPTMIVGMLMEKEEVYVLQPVNHFLRNADPDWLVLFKPEDLISSAQGTCKTPHVTFDIANPYKNATESSPPAKGSQRTFSCIEMEVAFCTDSRMYVDFNLDTDSMLVYNLTVMNIMEPKYDDFDIDFWVNEFFMVTSESVDDNPWGISLEVDELSSAFQDWANAYFGIADIGHLWTGGDLHYDNEDYGVAGFAPGIICDETYALLECMDPSNFTFNSRLMAHEYGHLFDAEHAEGTGVIMEPNINDITCDCWSVNNLEDMEDCIESASCLVSCVQCPLWYTIMDYIGWGDWRYSSLLYINSTAKIDEEADVIFQSEGHVNLLPGFSATSLLEPADGATFVAKIAPCEE